MTSQVLSVRRRAFLASLMTMLTRGVHQRVDRPAPRELAIGVDHLGLELDDVDFRHRGRHTLYGDAAAEADHEEVLGVRPRRDRDRRQPRLGVQHGRCAAHQDRRLRKPVGAQFEGAVGLGQVHRRRAAHREVQLVQNLCRRAGECSGADHGLRAARLEGHDGQQERRGRGAGMDAVGARDERHRPQRKPEVDRHRELDGSLEAESRNEQEPRQNRAGNRADRIPRIDFRRDFAGFVLGARQDPDRQGERGADEDRRRQHYRDRHPRHGQRGAAFGDQRPIQRYTPIDRIAMAAWVTAKARAARSLSRATGPARPPPSAMPVRNAASMVAKA